MTATERVSTGRRGRDRGGTRSTTAGRRRSRRCRTRSLGAVRPARTATVLRTWQACRVQLAMIGLGRMGANMAHRLMAAGHECVGYDVQQAAIDAHAAAGGMPAYGLDELVAALTPPRNIWIMVPA